MYQQHVYIKLFTMLIYVSYPEMPIHLLTFGCDFREFFIALKAA